MKKLLVLFYFITFALSCKKEYVPEKQKTKSCIIYIKATDVNGHIDQSEKIIVK